jgi:probable HAF family extracellular repeat protein
MTDLGTLGGDWCYPYYINEKGQVFGWSSTAGDLTSHAFLYSDGEMTDLGTLGGYWSSPDYINKKGQVIGTSTIAENLALHAFLYSDGEMTDLTQVVFDLFLVDDFYANGIHHGQIFGDGIWDGYWSHAYILTVPK